MGGGCEEGAEAAVVSSLLTNVAGCLIIIDFFPGPIGEYFLLPIRQQ